MGKIIEYSFVIYLKLTNLLTPDIHCRTDTKFHLMNENQAVFGMQVQYTTFNTTVVICNWCWTLIQWDIENISCFHLNDQQYGILNIL